MGDPLDANPHRKYMRDAEVFLITPDGIAPYRLLLCTDCIVYGPVLSSTRARFECRLGLLDVEVKDLTTGSEYSMEISSSRIGTACQMYMKTAEVTRDWIDCIRKRKVECLKEEAMRLAGIPVPTFSPNPTPRPSMGKLKPKKSSRVGRKGSSGSGNSDSVGRGVEKKASSQTVTSQLLARHATSRMSIRHKNPRIVAGNSEKQKICKGCGTVFSPRDDDVEYCSAPCRIFMSRASEKGFELDASGGGLRRSVRLGSGGAAVTAVRMPGLGSRESLKRKKRGSKKRKKNKKKKDEAKPGGAGSKPRPVATRIEMRRVEDE